MADNPPYLGRIQTAKLREALAALRIVVLTGARQTGKTTLARAVGEEEGRAFVTLDRPESLALAKRDPEALWEGLDKVTIDEVQRAPELLSYVKMQVDSDPVAGRFLLTGSANLLLKKSVSDSLAGRAGYITLPPLTLAERLERRPAGRLLGLLLEADDVASVLSRQDEFPAATEIPLPRAIFDGGYPEALRLPNDRSRELWREGYVATYLERDLRDLAQIGDLADFLRLLRLAAMRTGQLLNLDGLARDAGLASSTARRYLNLLEVSWQVIRLPAFASSRSKRLIKSPKLYCVDSGLACHLCGIREVAALAESRELGALLETYVLHHLMAFSELLPGGPRLLYWRTVRGEEVDFVLEGPDRLLPIEVKASQALRSRDSRGLEAFLEEYASSSPFGVILYRGREWLRLSRNILAIPWSALLAN